MASSPLDQLKQLADQVTPVSIPESFQRPEFRFCRVGYTESGLLKEIAKIEAMTDLERRAQAAESALKGFKKPHGNAWQKEKAGEKDEGWHTHDSERLLGWIRAGGNYGICAGSEAEYNGSTVRIFVLDADNFDAWERSGFFDSVSPRTFTVTSSTDNKRHYYYMTDLVSVKAHEELSDLGHFKFYASQCVGPGSLHPSGMRYTLINDVGLAFVDAGTLKEAVLTATKNMLPSALDKGRACFGVKPNHAGERLKENVEHLEEKARQAKVDRIKKIQQQETTDEGNTDLAGTAGTTVTDLLARIRADDRINPCLRRMSEDIQKRAQDFGGENGHHMRRAWAVALIKSGYSDREIHLLAGHFSDYTSARTQQQLDSVRSWVEKKGGNYYPCREIRAYLPPETCQGCTWSPPEQADQDPGRQEKARACIKLCGDLIRNEEEVLGAIYAYNTPPSIYQRGGSLCRIKQVSEDRYRIEDLSDYALRNELSRAATFQRFKPKKKDEETDAAPESKWQIIACEPPMSLVRGIMALDSWSVPRINGIIGAPAIRPDGSLLLEPGYDEATGMFFRPDKALTIPAIPETPTKDEAMGAAKFFVDEALHDFPFVDDASRAGALAAFLTPIVRPMIMGGVPMALIDKPAPGTGASLLLDLISIVSTGTPMAALSAPGDEEEWRKLITSVMRDGAALAALDNIASDLKADALSRALTSTIWKDRTLGKPDAAEYPQRACWYANGNNLALSGDLPRRSHLIQLDAKVEKPWTRTEFRHDNIKTWVMENRGALLASLLTLVRAWVIAGRPNGCKHVIGGFDEWVQILGGILDYASVPGFLGNLEKLYEEVDVGSDEWADFLAAWKDTYHEIGKTSSEVLEDLRNPYTKIGQCTPSELAERIKYRSPGDAKKVGQALRKKLNVICKNRLMLAQDTDAHMKQKLWRVVEAKTTLC